MKAYRRWMLILLGAVLMFSLFGCGKQQYRLLFDGGEFTAERTSYAAGESVTVYYDMIATDTDYTFSSDDVELSQRYDEQHGYVFTFVMPEHDVTLHVSWRNSMEYEPESTTLSFPSFDGGGPMFEAVLDDAEVVSCEKRIDHSNADHENVTGAGYHVIFSFTGLREGETGLLIEERSPIAGNYNRKYRVTVDEGLNVTLEEGPVTELYEDQWDMQLTINGNWVPVTWEASEAVEELKYLLPLTIQLSMYGGFEQVGDIGTALTGSDAQITAESGDVMLYSGDRIVLFYGSNDWAYTKLGHIDLTREELAELLGGGDVEITLER